MADTDLPCFSFRADWADGVMERLSFLTTVLRAEEGAEQRQSIRPTPRRSLEADFVLQGRERAFYDLFMHNLSGLEFTVPLYWDVAVLQSGTVAGNTTRLEFDTRWSEFTAGTAIILQGSSALDYELIMVDSVDDNGLDLATATARAWKPGTRVMPIRRCYVEDMGELQQPSADVATVAARFLVRDSNPWTPAADPSPVYLGLPVLVEEPNWLGGLSAELSHDVDQLDTGLGLPFQVDPVGRANVGQAHRYFLHGRERLARFRDLVYRHKGRRGAFWLPTFKRDMELVNSPGAAATQIEIENIGLQYVGGPSNGREHIVIWTYAGQRIIRKITGASPGLTQATEKVDLDAALGLALSPGQVRKISFLDTGRFDQDDFEITHHTSAEGLAEVNATFRTFKNTRAPAVVIDTPIAAAEMTGDPCGVEIASNCYAVPYVPVYEGWDYDVRWRVTSAFGRMPSQWATLLNGPAGFIDNMGLSQNAGERDKAGPGAYWSRAGEGTFATENIAGYRTTVDDRGSGAGNGVGSGIGNWSATFDFAFDSFPTNSWTYYLEWRHWTQEFFTSIYVLGPTNAQGAIDGNFTSAIGWAGHGVD